MIYSITEIMAKLWLRTVRHSSFSESLEELGRLSEGFVGTYSSDLDRWAGKCN